MAEDRSVLRVGSPFLEPVTPYVEPATANTPIGWHVVYNVYERLVEMERAGDGGFRIAPSLAESWQVSDRGRVCSFKLRADARFPDGRPVTAADVKFSLERNVRYGDPPSRFLPLWEVRVTGDRTLDLVLRERSATVLAVLSTAIGSILDRAAVPPSNDLGHTWLMTHSAGSGPFAIEHISEHELVLRANPTYWRGPAPLERVIVTDGADAAAQRSALERGDLDISMGVAPEDVPSFERDRRFIAERVGSHAVPHVMVRKGTKGPDGRLLTHNRQFTQAIKQALNYDAIADLFGGWGDGVALCQSGVLPATLSYDPSLASYYRHDPERARRLLREAGYPNGVGLDVSYWEALWGGVDTGRIAEQVHADLAKVGISGRLVGYASEDYWAIPDGSVHGLTVSMSAYHYPDPDDVPRRRMGWPGGVSGYDFAAAEKFVQAAEEQDQERRAELYRQLQRQYLEEAPQIYLLTFPYNVVRRSDLKGYAYPPNWSGPKFYGIAKG